MWQLTEHQQKAFTNLFPSIIIKIIKKKKNKRFIIKIYL